MKLSAKTLSGVLHGLNRNSCDWYVYGKAKWDDCDKFNYVYDNYVRKLAASTVSVSVAVGVSHSGTVNE